MKKTEVINIRVTKEEKKIIKELADKKQLTISQYIVSEMINRGKYDNIIERLYDDIRQIEYKLERNNIF